MGADVQKDVTLTAGKNVATIPLVSTELGKVTEISWKEKQVDPTQWVYKRHKTAEYNPGSGALYIATSDVTNLGEVDYCPGQVSTRGIFPTPIGLRVYLYQ